MRRFEYLAALAAALGDRDPSERDEILREMESHIEDLAERRPGISEEELVSGLTAPAALAAALRDEEAGAGETGRNDEAGRGGAGGGSPFDELRAAVRAFGGSLGADGEEWKGKVEAGPASILALSLAGGDIEASRWDRAEVGLELGLSGSSRRIAEWEPRLEREGGRLVLVLERGGVTITRAELKIPPSILRLELGSRSGDLEVEADGMDLGARTSSGEISVRDAGTVVAATASGDVEIDGAEGVDVDTQSGDISIRDAAGPLRAKSSSGDVEIADSGGRIEVETMSGDISVEEGAGIEGGRLRSRSGDIEIELGGASLRILAETVSGSIEAPGCDDQDEGIPRRHSSGEAGSPLLELRSVSGDIDIDA